MMMKKTDKLSMNETVLGLVARVVKGIRKDNCTGYAAEMAFFFLFALFPCLLSLTSLLAYLPVPDLSQILLRNMSSFLPDTVLALVEKNLHALIAVQKGGILSFGVLLSLWTSSNAMMAVQTALNDAYDTKEDRPYWQLRALSVLLVLCLASFMIVSLLLLFFGPRIGLWIASLASLGHPFNLTWNLLRWPVILALMMTALSALYRYAPALKLSWREITPGAVTATGAWVVVTLAFSYYANNFRSYDKTYGSIGAVIALLFWLYASAFVILLGGEINARLREMRRERDRT